MTELVDEPLDVEVLSSERVFRGAVWDIARETFRFGDGVLTRELMRHPGAVAVLAIDDQDRVLLIQQYRHPVGRLEWELPAGLLDVDGESPLDSAKRELAEEVDLVATDWSLLAEFDSTPGGSDEAITVFQATGISPAPEVFARTAEEAHMITRWVPFSDVVAAVLDGRVRNAILQIAVLTAHARAR
ncbi:MULTISPECIES: NUDIX hydrolase [unclassified Diaminobutyricimonas]|uniref:NUDIX domain-containing protein n=1 Tax=unclassified Diaminobutyricimonas TaxID=2643261 RepID=UPI001E487F1E|nr:MULTISPECIES: NUDIX hydrolase [unclassified Diaminobutyricimonas]